jgi:hypothetical protein
MGRVGIDDLEALQGLGLRHEERAALLATQTECTFVFSSEAGWPSGVVMTYIHIDGVFWLTAVEGRGQTKGIAKDPRATIVVSNRGTDLPGRQMAAYRCVVTVHRDRRTKAWFIESSSDCSRAAAPWIAARQPQPGHLQGPAGRARSRHDSADPRRRPQHDGQQRRGRRE